MPNWLPPKTTLRGSARKPLSRSAGYAAGRAFLRFRRKHGTKTGVLPDFFIGAQAQTEGWTILTRDVALYVTHFFSKVKLIAPGLRRSLELLLVYASVAKQFQLEQHGYFVVDRVDHVQGCKLVFNLVVGLKDSWGK